MKWTDSREIAIALAAAHQSDPARVLFVDLREWVLALPGFNDDPKRSGKDSGSSQSAWIDEAISRTTEGPVRIVVPVTAFMQAERQWLSLSSRAGRNQ